MILHPAPQGSEGWQAARAVIPTASNFQRIMSPVKRKFSSSAEGYIAELLAAWALGGPIDRASSSWMERGHTEEEAARRWYSFTRDAEVEEVGLCLRDDERVGASPDGLVGEDGGLEVKSLAIGNHIEALLGDPAADYICQIQGGLYITGRKWWDTVFWNPAVPSTVIRVERDEEFIAALHECIEEFLRRLEAGRARLVALGVEPPPPDEPVEPSYPNDEPTPEQVAAFNRALAGSHEPVEVRHGPDFDAEGFPF